MILTLDPSSPKGPIGPSSPLEINQNKSLSKIVFKNRNLYVLHLCDQHPGENSYLKHECEYPGKISVIRCLFDSLYTNLMKGSDNMPDSVG